MQLLRRYRVPLILLAAYGSNGLLAVASIQVEIEDRREGEGLEARTYFADTGNIILSKVTVAPLD
jgi:hypothetical protein